MKDIEALEIDVGPIHDIKGIGLRQNLIENVHVMNLAVSNLNESGDGASYVEQGVHLHGAFSGSKPGPRNQRQAEVDGRGIQCVDGVVEIDSDGVLHIHWPSQMDQHLSEIGEDPPVMSLIGIGKSGAGNLATEAYVIELAAHGTKACFNVAQTLTVSQLGESESKELIPARKSAEFIIAIITSYAFLELIGGKGVHQLRGYRSARDSNSL